MNRFFIATGFLILFLLGFRWAGTAAYAQSNLQSIRWQRMLNAMDANEDGQISASEWQGRRPFNQVDRNQDGVISPADWAQEAIVLHPVELPSFAELLYMLDSDGDRCISRSEWSEIRAGFLDRNGNPVTFEMLDNNGDECISFDEYLVNKLPAPTNVLSFMLLLKIFDSSGDRRLSAGEWTAAGLEFTDENGNPLTFDSFDTNGDGSLTFGDYANRK